MGNSWSPSVCSRVQSVRPRVHGELDCRPFDPKSAPGSSPQARGTPRVPQPEVIRHRFIPAYTGNSIRGYRRCGSGAVHPRVHGKLVPSVVHRDPVSGSSPRTRGTQQMEELRRSAARFIPAYTGNSHGRRIRGGRRPVHPRVHGELGPRHSMVQAPFGSSPRTRGTLADVIGPLQLGRFIPAYTGNSPTGSASHAARSVHPRVHGELQVVGEMEDDLIGSSPRTRGTLDKTRLRGRGIRFIPAYTGNSPSGRRARPTGPVHPRVHGELHCEETSPKPSIGSSPRTRGTRFHVGLLGAVCRFIPAYTGNSRCCPSRGRRTPVHPRVHGEL